MPAFVTPACSQRCAAICWSPRNLLVFLLVSYEPQGDDTNMLNDTRVRNAKRGDRPIKLSDSGGLHLLIQPNGSKLWRLASGLAENRRLWPLASIQRLR
jgi:hypothetical protein